MSWLQRLHETYEHCAQGDTDAVGTYADGQPILLPVAHTLIKAHITVTLYADGAFISAAVSDGDPDTIAPCTEDSDSRTSAPEPHALFDKLEYLAGDYGVYVEGGGKKKKKADAESPYALYLKALHGWAHSDCSHPQLRAIYAYIARGTLMADLVRAGVLVTDADGMVLTKWTGDKESAPRLYGITNLEPHKAFARFIVLGSGDKESRVWRNKAVQDAFIRYTFRGKDERLCYVTGETAPAIAKHPKKIINILANAKLISANDSSGFTYRGRFSEGEQASSVAYAASHKAHNALRWLIERQAFRNGEQTILAWSTGGGRSAPLPTFDSDEFFSTAPGEPPQPQPVTAMDAYIKASAQLAQHFAKNLTAALLGYKHNLDAAVPIVVMALDCATVGRLSITYYRELAPGEYLERIRQWHEGCAWLHTYKKEDIEGEKNKKRTVAFVGAPSLKDIALAAYGARADARVVAATVKRLLPCVFDGTRLPGDIVKSAVRRASNPTALEYWEWNKALSIACALYRKRHETEGYTLALDENRTDRAYLFGRLLAVADEIEKWALRAAGAKQRETNAMRYMNTFSQKPIRTWKTIVHSIVPYQARLGAKARYYNDLITNIMSKFEDGDYESADDKPLDGLYLLGYHCQRQIFIDRAIEAAQKKGIPATGIGTDIDTDTGIEYADGGMDNEP